MNRCPKCFILEGSESAQLCEIEGCPQRFDSGAVPKQGNPKPKRAKRGRPRGMVQSVWGVWVNQPERLLARRIRTIQPSG